MWEAIALHTSPGIAERQGPITRYTRIGATRDFAGLPPLAPDLDDLAAPYPRLEIEVVLPERLIAQSMRKPEKAPATSWAGVLRERSLRPRHPALDG